MANNFSDDLTLSLLGFQMGGGRGEEEGFCKAVDNFQKASYAIFQNL